MTTELATVTNGHVPALPAPGTTAAALEMLRGHAEMMSAAHTLASAMVGTQMVPAIYRRRNKDDMEAAENATAAILYGAEIGLNPIQSLQQVFPIHGQPAIYARTMVALLKARGYRFRTDESTDERVTVTGTSPAGESETSTWDIARARRAGYTSNKKYETDPQAMLYAKACAEVCRKLAPDVLLGISHTREDLELEPPEPVRVTSERVSDARLSNALYADAVKSPEEWEQTGPPVQQWQPPADDPSADEATASEEVEKPDTAQVEDSAQASPEPVVEMATSAEQRALSDQLERHGHKTPAAKRAYLSKETGRKIGSAKDLHGFEARAITDRLTSLADPDQIAALRAALEADKVHAEGKQLDWIRDNGAPGLGDWDDLDADLAVDLTLYLRGEQAKDAAKANGGQTALDTDGAGQ